MIYWITGRGKSGKTTLARRLAKQINGIILAGEDIREYFPQDYTLSGRRANLELITNFALILEKQGFNVIICCQSPNYQMRKELQSKFEECLEIQLPFGNNDAWGNIEYEETPL